MKSKIKKIQILKKGISLLLMFLITFSLVSVNLPVFAEDDETQIDEDDNENIEFNVSDADEADPESAEEKEEKEEKETIAQLLSRIESLEDTVNSYKNFKEKVQNNSVIDITKEIELRYLSIYNKEEKTAELDPTCAGKTFNIRNDIQLTSIIEWEPIGNKTTPFKGRLNGYGYIISGMSIVTKHSYAGLIGYLGEGGEAVNIVIADSNIDIKANIDGTVNDLEGKHDVGYSYLGAIAGYAQGSSIVNCINKSNVGGGSYVGGIVGAAVNTKSKTVTIKNCINSGLVQGYYYVGGIVGKISGKAVSGAYNSDYSIAQACVNTGNVYAYYANAGGIAGSAFDKARIDSCLNQGNVSINKSTLELNVLGTTITLRPENVGGIVGITSGEGTNNKDIKNKTLITKCINDEDVIVSGYKDVGGIAGQLGGTVGGYSEMQYCISYSDKVSSTETYGSGEKILETNGVLVGCLGGKSVKKDGKETYQGGRIYNSYYYGKNESFTSTNIQAQGAIGNIIGSMDYDGSHSNKAFKISKDGSGKYIWQGYIYTKDGNAAKSIAGKRGFVIKSAGEEKIWRYANQNNGVCTYPTANKDENMPTNSYPTYSDTTGFVAGDDKTNNGATYQHWLYGLVNKTGFEFDANGKAYIDTVKPTILGAYVRTEEGDSIAIKDDTIIISVRYDENLHHSAVKKIPKLTFKIGNTSCTSTFVGIEGNYVRFAYKIKGTENGKVSNIAISYDYLYDVFNNIAVSDDTIVNKNIKKNITAIENGSESDIIVKKQNKDSNGEPTWGVTYTLQGGSYKNGIKYINSNDTLTIIATIDKKVTNDVQTIDSPSIKLKIGGTVETIKFDTAKDTIEREPGETIITYNSKTIKNEGKLTNIYLETTSNYTMTGESDNYTEKLSSTNTGAKVSNVIIDKTAPTLDLVVSKKERFEEGDKIVVEATSSEKLDIDDKTKWPKMIFKFGDKLGITNAGVAEVAYISEDSKGNTKLTYEYTIANGDDGKLSIAMDGAISDIAGNKTTFDKNAFGEVEKYADTVLPTVAIKANKTNPTNADLILYTFDFSEKVDDFTIEDITVNNGTKGKFTEVTKGLKYTLEVTPVITKGNEGDLQVIVEQNACQDLSGHKNVRTENIVKVDKKAPSVEVKSNKAKVNGNEKITYEFIWSEAVKDFTIEDITINNGTKGKFSGEGNYYTLEVSPVNGNDVEVSIEAEKCTDIAGNSNIASAKHVIAVLPTVEIYTNVSNPTNSNTIIYTFKWSEEVTGFDVSDIILPNGVTGTLKDNTMTIDYNEIIALGNEGEVTVAVKENAAQDANGNYNAYSSNTTKIDRISPILIGLEAYAESTNIKLDSNVDNVKQYYKVGDKVTIIATFTENIEKSTAPKLALQFSESGNAKGTVSVGTISGNKITYTYTIVEGDLGKLSVKGFSGNVVDAAGNETTVTRRELTGDVIFADSKTLALVGLTAIIPDFEYDELLKDNETKRYGLASKERDNNTITIIAEYNENVYTLNEGTINKITTVPVLTIKFGTGSNRTITEGIVEGNKIKYTYNIQEGDNGDLSIVSLNGTVSDVAGNTLTTTTSLPVLVMYEKEVAEGNKVENIEADTTVPNIKFAIIETVNKDANGKEITGNEYYYREGAEITITATTDEYVYENTNKSLERFTVENAPTLNISFATTGKGIGTCTGVEYKDNETVFTYKYQIKENDNGILNLNIAEQEVSDIALNTNSNATSQVPTIIADTQKPVTNWQAWVESERYGIIDSEDGKWVVTFNEKLYVYDNANNTVGEELSNSNKDKAPILLVTNDNVTVLETTIDNIAINDEGKTVITYSYAPYTKNIAAYGIKIVSISDKAGNLFNYKDQVAPILTKIEVTSPEAGIYKAGEVITIVATYSEQIVGEVPTLSLQFSESGDAKGELSEGVIKGNTITYTYTIADEENGQLSIKSFTGTGLTDLVGNKWIAPEEITLSGNSITADTKVPTLTITSDVEKTNKDVVIYTFTWSEPVYGFTKDDIEVTNGSKGEFTGKDGDTVYTLKVDTTDEGRQVVKVISGTCEDIAKNPYVGTTTYNKVVIDYTKPTIRAKVNGGNYVVDTETRKSVLKETIVVNEELSKFEYVWTTSTEIPSEGWLTEDITSVDSDINLTKEVEITEEKQTYYLHLKITDLAGNTLTTKTKGFVVENSNITLTPSSQEMTNQDVTVTVEYGNGLTEDRKAGISGKTQSADSSKVIVSENGIIYAEAADKAGNKVYATLEVKNIDKDIPEVSFEYLALTAKLGETIKATIATTEEAKISYKWNNGKWITSEEYITTLEVENTPTEAGLYTLYAKAIDKTGNESKVETLQFAVIIDFEDLIEPEIIFEDLPVVQVDGIKYVKIPENMTTEVLTSKMNKEALCGATPEYANLMKDGDLKTTSEIKLNGKTKYIIVVKGDINCDGKVTFKDIINTNTLRISKQEDSVSKAQFLAADINNNSNIEFRDIISINSIRINSAK